MSRMRGLTRWARPPSSPRERAGRRQTGSSSCSLGVRMAGRSLATCSTRHHDQENSRGHHRGESRSGLGGGGAHPRLAVAGLQARAAPPVLYVRDLIRQGYVGQVLSTTLIGSGMGWGPTVAPYNVYMNDRKNGATLLSIALGHAADALCYCLGEVRELSATMTMRRKSFTIAGTEESRPMKADDQVSVTGLLEGGAALSIHYRGGRSRGTNLLWEINGTEGDLQVTADGGQAQIFDLTVRGGNRAHSSLQVLPVPPQYRFSPLQGPGTNVAQAYANFARDYREGTHLSALFADGAIRHPMLSP